jgi:hypothetical protein
MKLIYWCFIAVLLQSCYGINEKTSEISTLNTNCLSSNAWDEIKREYSADGITNPKLNEGLKEFENLPFTTEVFYFKNNPEELIAVSTDHYAIRYVYNPKISNQILDGLSLQLKDKEKKRIKKRIQTLLIQYQCEEGRIESLKAIEE